MTDVMSEIMIDVIGRGLPPEDALGITHVARAAGEVANAAMKDATGVLPLKYQLLARVLAWTAIGDACTATAAEAREPAIKLAVGEADSNHIIEILRGNQCPS